MGTTANFTMYKTRDSGFSPVSVLLVASGSLEGDGCTFNSEIQNDTSISPTQQCQIIIRKTSIQTWLFEEEKKN